MYYLTRLVARVHVVMSRVGCRVQPNIHILVPSKTNLAEAWKGLLNGLNIITNYELLQFFCWQIIEMVES